MNKIVNISGLKFNYLTVIKLDLEKKQKWAIFWICKCDCGKFCSISASKLKSGHTKSCGCLRRILSSKRRRTHNKSLSKVYHIWSSMKSRCNNPKCKNYHNYGGRGIKVCDRWLESFENFYEDIGDKPVGLTLHRIDNNGNYCKENCVWSNGKTQGRNRRNNHILEYNGEKKCIAEWAEILKIKSYTLLRRLCKSNWSIEKSFNKPIRSRILTFNNESYNMEKWGKKLNISPKTIWSRLKAGWSIEKTLITPKINRKNSDKSKPI